MQLSNSWNDNNGNYVHATMGCVYEGQKHYIIFIYYTHYISLGSNYNVAGILSLAITDREYNCTL